MAQPQRMEEGAHIFWLKKDRWTVKFYPHSALSKRLANQISPNEEIHIRKFLLGQLTPKQWLQDQTPPSTNEFWSFLPQA